MLNLSDRRILVVCATFFDYAHRLVSELERRGATVDFLDERPSNVAWMKFLLRKSPAFLHPVIDRYYDRFLVTHPSSYDDILFVGCQTETEHVLKAFRQRYPSARLILYLWDSLKNTPGIESKFFLFDRCFSFDNRDIARFPCLRYAYWGFTSEFTPMPPPPFLSMTSVSWAPRIQSGLLSFHA